MNAFCIWMRTFIGSPIFRLCSICVWIDGWMQEISMMQISFYLSLDCDEIINSVWNWNKKKYSNRFESFDRRSICLALTQNEQKYTHHFLSSQICLHCSNSEFMKQMMNFVREAKIQVKKNQQHKIEREQLVADA